MTAVNADYKENSSLAYKYRKLKKENAALKQQNEKLTENPSAAENHCPGLKCAFFVQNNLLEN